MRYESPSDPLRSHIPHLTSHCALSLPKRRVEGDAGRREVDPFHEGAGLGGAGFAVHAAVFPLDGERALVADVVEGADDLLEVDAAVAKRAEVPVATRIAEVEVSAEDAGEL